MPLIKDDKMTADPWVTVADDEALPEDGQPIVSLDRWQSDRTELLRRNAPIGIRLKSDQPPNLIAEDLDHFAVVALEFPKFTDGRAFSYARLLRERYGYAGELRAVGNVLRDQLLFMQRCGFDAFEVAEGTPLEDWLKAKSEISVWYQPATDGRTPVSVLRRGRKEPAGAPASTADEAAIVQESGAAQWAY
ncbi:MAG: DUF934 domain-containing protein [Kiloniellaceae bacterium]